MAKVKLPSVLKDPVFLFLVKLFALYLIWYFLYDLWLHTHTNVDLFVVNHTIGGGRFILELLGYVVFEQNRLIGIEGTAGLLVGDPCDGIALFATFSAFIIAFPGSVIKKLVFIPFGIITLFLLNIARVVALTIIETYSYELTEINHTYTFTIIIYGYIFFLWMLWVGKCGKEKVVGS